MKGAVGLTPFQAQVAASLAGYTVSCAKSHISGHVRERLGQDMEAQALLAMCEVVARFRPKVDERWLTIDEDSGRARAKNKGGRAAYSALKGRIGLAARGAVIFVVRMEKPRGWMRVSEATAREAPGISSLIDWIHETPGREPDPYTLNFGDEPTIVALSRISSRSRDLLTRHVIEGERLLEIGKIYRRNASTMKRYKKRAIQELLEAVQREHSRC
jgi:hypothetical protein